MMQFLSLIITLIIFEDERKHREWERSKGE